MFGLCHSFLGGGGERGLGCVTLGKATSAESQPPVQYWSLLLLDITIIILKINLAMSLLFRGYSYVFRKGGFRLTLVKEDRYRLIYKRDIIFILFRFFSFIYSFFQKFFLFVLGCFSLLLLVVVCFVCFVVVGGGGGPNIEGAGPTLVEWPLFFVHLGDRYVR